MNRASGTSAPDLWAFAHEHLEHTTSYRHSGSPRPWRYARGWFYLGLAAGLTSAVMIVTGLHIMSGLVPVAGLLAGTSITFLSWRHADRNFARQLVAGIRIARNVVSICAFVLSFLIPACAVIGLLAFPHDRMGLLAVALGGLLGAGAAAVFLVTLPPLIIARSWDEPLWLRGAAIFAFFASGLICFTALVRLANSSSALVTTVPLLLTAGGLILNALLLANRDSNQRATDLEQALADALLAMRRADVDSYDALFHLCATIRRLERGGRFIPTPRPLSEPLRVVLFYATQAEAGIGGYLLTPAQRRELRELLTPDVAAQGLPALIESLHDQLLDGRTAREDRETEQANKRIRQLRRKSETLVSQTNKPDASTVGSGQRVDRPGSQLVDPFEPADTGDRDS